jgi:nucleoside-diphosphate-sugar epimerase
LLTGATGFIGRHLIENLLKLDNVTIIALSRIPLVIPNQKYVPYAVDMSNWGWTESIPSSVDVVVHLSQSRKYRAFPDGAIDMVRINIDATSELLEWSRKNKVQRFLFASTGNVYKPKPNLLTEVDICEPDSMYAATKLSAEFIVHLYSQFFQTIVMRLFGVYGPSQKEMVIATMIDRVCTGQKITLAKGTGLYLTPLYISDCIAMIKGLLVLDIAQSQTFNLAGKEIIHLGQIVSLIADRTQQTPIIAVTDEKPYFLQGNSEKIYKAINYRPQVNFSEGIDRMISAVEFKKVRSGN